MKLYLSICFVWFYFCLVLNKTAADASRRDPLQKHVCSTARLATRPHALRPCPRHQGVAISNLRSLIFFVRSLSVYYWRGQGRVHIAGWSYGGVGPVRGLRGGGRRGWCEEWASMELGSSFLFLQEQIKDIIIIFTTSYKPVRVGGGG